MKCFAEEKQQKVVQLLGNGVQKRTFVPLVLFISNQHSSELSNGWWEVFTLQLETWKDEHVEH